MKIYENQYASLRYSSELSNGVYFHASSSYNDRIPLVNTQTWFLKKYSDREFTSNNPQYPDSAGYSFQRNYAIIADIGFTFRIKQKFYTRPNQKIIIGSKYPEIRINYKKGLGEVNFDLVKASISKEIHMKLQGDFTFLVSCGKFLNKSNLYFMDYIHFNGNQTIFSVKAKEDEANIISKDKQILMGFNLLPYYKYSTTSDFVEVHVEHHFNGWLINKIPLLRKTRFQEVAGFHYLTTKDINQYIELSVGLEKIGIPGIIPGIFRIDFVTALSSGTKITNGFRIGWCVQNNNTAKVKVRRA